MAGDNKGGEKPADDIDLDTLVRAGADDDYSDLESPDGVDRGDAVEDDAGKADNKADDKADDAEGQDADDDAGKADDKADDAEDQDDADKADDAEDQDDAEDDAEGKKPRSKMIPRERFDEVNNKLKTERKAREALEAKLAAGKGAEPGDKQPPADPDKDLKDKLADVEDQYEEALLDGDKAKAKEFRAQRRDIEEQIVDRKAQRAANAARKAVPEDVKLQAAVDELSAKYPQLNNEHEDYDAALTEEALDLAETFRAKGLSLEKALRKAVDYVAKANDLKTAGEEVDDAEDGEPPAKKKTPAPTPAQRKSKLDAATKQPPKGVPRGKEEPATPVADDLTEEEFDALPESKKRVMRGDSV